MADKKKTLQQIRELVEENHKGKEQVEVFEALVEESETWAEEAQDAVDDEADTTE